MNGPTLKGKWSELKGRVKEKWGELTDDDLARIEGRRDQLIGLIRQRYGKPGSRSSVNSTHGKRTTACVDHAPCAVNDSGWEGMMLWTIFVILLVLWLLGMVSVYTLGGFIHVLLVVAIAVVLIRVIQGRAPV